MGQPAPQVFIVDDEPSIRDLLETAFLADGYRVHCFADGGSFLAAARQNCPDAVLLDIILPERSGLDVLHDIKTAQYPAQVFIMSGHGDIATAVTAIRIGAIDFIEKPFIDIASIPARIREALSARAGHQKNVSDDGPISPFSRLLTPREHDVLNHITGGSSNKEIARELAISPRTVEVHRARIMDKLSARNAADLVRIVLSGRAKHATSSTR